MAKAYFNGVLLPEVPADVLKDYPYCWIMNESSQYSLIFGKKPWYANSYMNCQNSSDEKWYTIQKSSASSATAWSFSKNTSGTFSIDSSRPVMWSNHDVPNGSATSTSIYFYGTCPIPQAPSGSCKLVCNGTQVPPFPTDMITGYPYCAVLCWPTGNVQLIGSKNGFYYDGGNAIRDKSNAALKAYNLASNGWVEDASQSLKYSGWTAISDGIKVLKWSNQNIPSGSSTASTLYLESSEPYITTQVTKYLIRISGMLFTISTNGLTPVTGELNASLFQSQGFDIIPSISDWSEIPDPELLTWTDSVDNLPVVTAIMSATASPQTLYAEPFYLTDSTIAGIDSVACEYEGSPLIALSFNGGAYEYYNNGWVPASDTQGMLPSALTSISKDVWASKVQGVESIQIRVILNTNSDTLTRIKFTFINNA